MDQSNDKNSSISEEKSSLSELSGTSSFLHRLQFTSIHSDEEFESYSGSQLLESQLSGTTSVLDGIRFSPFDSNEEITSNHSDESNHSNAYVKSVAEIILERQASADELVNQPTVERFDIMEPNSQRAGCYQKFCCCRVKLRIWTIIVIICFISGGVVLSLAIPIYLESKEESDRIQEEFDENFSDSRWPTESPDVSQWTWRPSGRPPFRPEIIWVPND